MGGISWRADRLSTLTPGPAPCPRVELEQQRRSTLAQMVDEDLLRMEAARRGITPEQLIHDEVESKVALPTQDEISAAYRQILGDKQIPPDTSFEQYRAALLESRQR